MIAVETRDLRHVYSVGTPFERVAVDGISVAVEQGAMVGVIGHTGSGKSTFIQHLNGLLKPTSGSVLIGGKDVWAEPKKIREFRFRVGLVFQYPEYQLFEETVAKDIAFGPRNMGLSESEIADRVRAAAQAVEIPEELMERSPFEISGGQKRRVAIAGVLAMQPEVLILDEPTAGLDPGGRNTILRMIADYHKKTGNTTLLVSHSMEDIAAYTERVMVINDAALFAYGTVGEVYARTDELVSMGLAVPQVSRIFAELRRRGFGVDPHVYTVEAARDELLRLLRKGGDR